MKITQVVVGIIFYTDSGDFEHILASVLSQKTFEKFTFSVTVVDISSGYAGRVAACKQKLPGGVTVDYYPFHVKNIAAAKNFIIANNRGDYFVFLDQHCLPPEEWLYRLWYDAQSGRADIVYGQVAVGKTRYAQGYCYDNYLLAQASIAPSRFPFDVSAGHGQESVLLFASFKRSGKAIVRCAAAAVFIPEEKGESLRSLRKQWYYEAAGDYIVNRARLSGAADRLLRIYLLCGFVGWLFFLLLTLPVSMLCRPWRLICLRRVYRYFGPIGVLRNSWGHPFYERAFDRMLAAEPQNPIPLEAVRALSGRGDKPHITVCLATYRRAEYLKKLLSELSRQCTADFFTYSLVVVDNDDLCSAQALVAEMRESLNYRIDYYREPVKNIALARNLAVMKSRGDCIAFIDDDEYPSENWLLSLYLTMILSGADIVQGPAIAVADNDLPAWLKHFWVYKSQACLTGESDICYSTNNCLVRSGLIKKYPGPFPAKLGLAGGEDIFLFRSLARDGAVGCWCAQGYVYEHLLPERRKIFWWIKRFYRFGNNHADILAGDNVFYRKINLFFLHLLYFFAGCCLLPYAVIHCCIEKAQAYTYVYRFFRLLGCIGGLLNLRYYEYA